MNLEREHHAESGGGSRDRALSRIVAEIQGGLRHGYFRDPLSSAFEIALLKDDAEVCRSASSNN